MSSSIDKHELARLEKLSSLEPLSPELTARLLELRALALAPALETVGTFASHLNLVAFRINAARFSIPAERIVEVREGGKIALLPEAPDFILGLVAYRGQLVAALDLGRFFGAGGVVPGPAMRLVFIADAGRQLAIAIDELLGLKRVTLDTLAAAPTTLPSELSNCIEGIDAEGIQVLSCEHLLQSPRFQA